MTTKQEEEEKKHNGDPFIILHYYRTNKRKYDHPEKAKRHPHDYTLDRKSIIMTRRMMANLEQKSRHEVSQEESVPNQLSEGSGAVEEENREFFNQNQLENCIPMADKGDEDILFNLNQLSRASNYSKLEKTLFGLPQQQRETSLEFERKSEL